MLEQRGVPTIVLGTYEFEQLAQLEAKNRGVADLPLALIPHPLGGIREDEALMKAELALDVVVREPIRAMTRPRAGVVTALGPAARTLGSTTTTRRSTGSTRAGLDGRPADRAADGGRVAEFLRHTTRDRREVVAVLPPRQGEATVERIAINAVMAGCRPEYFPVVIAAVEALAQPPFNLDSVQATTHPVAPLMIVNGPIAKEIGLNGGYNAFGQGFRPNLTIGRALRLVLMNVGGGLPGTGDRATQGSPAKIAYCVAENEDANPWEPLHVELGFDRT